MHLHHILCRNTSRIKSREMHLNRLVSRRDLHDVQSWWSGGPGVTEDRLEIAVHHSHMWCCWVGFEEEGRLVECRLGGVALTVTGLVAAGDKDPPFFWLGGGWGYGVAKGGLPVGKGEDVNVGASGLGGGSVGSVVGVPVWDEWGGEVGVLLEFCLDVVEWSLQWDLLSGGGEERKRHEGGGGGETHLGVVDV